jgi:hypothetical protein
MPKKVRKTVIFPSEEFYRELKASAAKHGLKVGEYIEKIERDKRKNVRFEKDVS